MFRHLRTKLTVLYATLFGVTLLVIASVVSIAVANNATNVVNNELEANRDVFNRLWQMRADQLHDSADVLARDFGFRSAIASGDTATINSALENLRERLNLDRAFLIETDASIVGLPHGLPQHTSNALWQALDATGDASGVLILDGAPFQAVAAPVRAPDTIGWVVFAAALNSAQMRSFEDLAPIAIRAQAFTRENQRPWMGHDLSNGADLPMFARLLLQHSGQAQQIDLASGRAIAIATPLPSMTPEDRTTSTALVLSYPLARALAPYNLLLAMVIGAGVMGLALVVCGSWALAQSLTKPITALDAAAHLLEQGEAAHVAVSSNDEIARLATSFNAMAAGIKERERRIHHLGLFDPESQLPNRRAFERVVAKLQGNGRAVAIIAIGINRFEHVRDAIGYALAGELVRAFGARLTDHFGVQRVGRLSTDKLVLIVASADAETLIARAMAIQARIEGPVRVGDHAVDIMTTFGICPACAGVGAAAQTTNASIAIGQAQRAQRKAMLFDPEAYGDPSQNLALISELNGAMRSGDAWLVHQAKYDMRTRTVTGVEALMRWRHPHRGMISPDLFITMAEETGHVRALTDWVLQRAIDDQAAMRAAGVDLTVSVNISGRLLGDFDFAERAIQIIERARARICFEITETALIDNAQQALAAIEYCQKAGVGVSIDDYGAGLSSLSYLKQIPAQELKIDKGFVLALANSRRDALLIKSTIDLAHSLGMKVTAEGVETPEVLAMLAGMGCDLAQGYLIGRPLPLTELLPTFRRRSNAAHVDDVESRARLTSSGQ